MKLDPLAWAGTGIKLKLPYNSAAQYKKNANEEYFQLVIYFIHTYITNQPSRNKMGIVGETQAQEHADS